jgi:hypothetical protein
MRLITTMILTILIALFTSPALASDVEMAWNEVVDATGYKIYMSRTARP